MSTQKERFEAAWLEQFGGAGIDESVELAVAGNGDYCVTSTACEFRMFQLGEASGLERAAKVCGEVEDRFLNARDIDDDYSPSGHCANTCGILAKQIRALMAQGGDMTNTQKQPASVPAEMVQRWWKEALAQASGGYSVAHYMVNSALATYGREQMGITISPDQWTELVARHPETMQILFGGQA